MTEQANVMRAHAEQALADAAATKLANVRDRCLRAAAAWTAMAERSERTQRGRDRRDAEGAGLPG